MARVALEAVEKAWEDAVAVRGIDLEVPDGAFYAILGPSGCGKSTTLLMLAGIYGPTGGEIRFDGARVNEVEPRERNVGIVFQSYALYPNMSVMENILFPLRFKRLPAGEARRRAGEMAELVRISELLDRRPGQLSGGQQQRVALARALVKRPGLLLLDEPLSNLDAALRLTMRAEIRRVQLELGVTTLLVTHDQVEATTMAERIVVMNAGRIEQVGAPDDLYAGPESLFVAGFIGTPPMNLLSGEVREGHLVVGDLSWPAPVASQTVTVGLRPEAIEAAEGADGANGGGGRHTVEGRIGSRESMGREVLYLAHTAAGPLRFLEAGPVPRHGEGDRVMLRFAADSLFLFDAHGRRLATPS